MARDIAVLRSSALLSVSRSRRVRIVISALVVLLASGCQQDSVDTPVPFHYADEALVKRALELYASSGNSTDPALKRQVYPVVVHLPKMICVGMNLRPGVVGGDETICFNKSDGSIAIRYVNGE